MTELLDELKRLDFSKTEFAVERAKIAPQTLERIIANEPVRPKTIRKVKDALAKLKAERGSGPSQ